MSFLKEQTMRHIRLFVPVLLVFSLAGCDQFFELDYEVVLANRSPGTVIFNFAGNERFEVAGNTTVRKSVSLPTASRNSTGPQSPSISRPVSANTADGRITRTTECQFQRRQITTVEVEPGWDNSGGHIYCRMSWDW